MIKEEKIERGLLLFGKIMLVTVVLVNAWVTYRYYFNFVTADDASELVLSKMLAAEGGVLSTNWHYSTELEILNTQLVYSFLFRFISNFKVVRILGQVILSGIFLASYYFCLYSMDKEKVKKRFFLTAFLLLIPISQAWVYLILKTYYIPHVAITFVALGFACLAQREDLSKRQRICVFSLGSLLAFVGCLEGMRHIQMAYLPLVLSSVWMLYNALETAEWDLKRLSLPRGILEHICWLLCAGAGFLVNAFVLSGIYDYKDQNNATFTETLAFENIEKVWNAFLEVTGYTGEQKMMSFGGICNALAVLGACALFYVLIRLVCNIKKQQRIEELMVGFVVLSFALSMFIFIALKTVSARYVMACVAPMVLFFVFLENFPFLKRTIILLGVYGVVMVLGIHKYHEIQLSDKNENLRNVYEFVVSNDYTYGYSTFWSGNLLTELTNGAFQTRSVRGDYENQKLKIYHWLTPVQVEYREEPIICILEKKRVEDLPLPESWNMLMEDEEYMIYELPAHREVEEYLERRQL